MQTSTQASNTRSINKNLTTSPKKHHFIRTPLASLCGTIALALIFSSILVVWLNRTLTDTTTYVSTVTPLVTKPAVQTFLADTITDQIVKQAPIDDIAHAILPAGQADGK